MIGKLFRGTVMAAMLPTAIMGARAAEPPKLYAATAESGGYEAGCVRYVPEVIRSTKHHLLRFAFINECGREILVRIGTQFATREGGWGRMVRLKPGVTLKKTWRVVNPAAFAWPEGVQIVAISGDIKSVKDAYPVAAAGPNQTVDVDVEVIVPVTAGRHSANFRLRDPQGNYAWESDFGSYYRRLRERLQLSEKSEIKPGASGENCLDLTLAYPDPQTHKTRREVWCFAPDSWLLLRMTAFEDGRQVESAEFRDYKENTGIKDSFFDL